MSRKKTMRKMFATTLAFAMLLPLVFASPIYMPDSATADYLTTESESSYQSYAASGFNTNSQAYQDLQTDVDDRYKVMLGVLENDPSAFLANTIDPTIRQNLPTTLQDKIETPVTVNGDVFEIIIEQPNGQATSAYGFNDGTNTYLLQTPNENVPVGTGTVTGYEFEGNLVALNSNVAITNPSTPTTPTKHRVLAILVNYQDAPPSTITTTEINTAINPGGAVSDLYKEMSYDKVIMTGDTIEINLNEFSKWDPGLIGGPICRWDTESTIGVSKAYKDDWDDIKKDARRQGKDPSNYDYIALFINSKCKNLRGFAYYPGNGRATNHIVSHNFVNNPGYGSSYLQNGYYWHQSVDTFAHEFGHNLDMRHANSKICDDQGKSCVFEEYGNSFDTMGYSLHGDHYNFEAKVKQKWLDSSSIQTINGPGLYTINSISETTGIRKIHINPTNWVEYRSNTKFDQVIGSENTLLLYSRNLFSASSLLRTWTDSNGAFYWGLTQGKNTFKPYDSKYIIGPVWSTSPTQAVFEVRDPLNWKPIVTIKSDKANVQPGDTATISWQASADAYCTTDFPQVSTKIGDAVGSEVIAIFQTKTFTVSCKRSQLDNGAPVTASVTVTAQGTPITPKITLTVTPTSTYSRGEVTLTWNVVGASQCTGLDDWPVLGSVPLAGTTKTRLKLKTLSTTHTFTLYCTNGVQSDQKSVIVTERPYQNPVRVAQTSQPLLPYGTRVGSTYTLSIWTDIPATCKIIPHNEDDFNSPNAITMQGAGTTNHDAQQQISSQFTNSVQIKCSDTTGAINDKAYYATTDIANNPNEDFIPPTIINDNMHGKRVNTYSNKIVFTTDKAAICRYDTVAVPHFAKTGVYISSDTTRTTHTINYYDYNTNGVINLYVTCAVFKPGWFSGHFGTYQYIISYVVDLAPPKVTAIIAPTTTLPATTTSTTLSITTDENTDCAYSKTYTDKYIAKTKFTTTGGTIHNTTISGLAPGSNTQYILCQDTAGNIMYNPYTVYIDVSVGSSTNPVISSVTVNPSATSANIQWTTDLIAQGVIEYATSPSFGMWTTPYNKNYITTHLDSLTNLSPNTVYHYRITAQGLYGYSQYTNQFTTPAAPQPPATPTNVVATATNPNTIQVTWSAVSGATGYRIERATSQTGTYVLQGSPSTNTYIDNTGINPATTYWYRVYSYNNNGNSATSTAVSTTTPSSDTTAPTATIIAPTSNQILIGGTTSTTLSVTTNEAATCKWSTTDQTYTQMINTFTNTGSASHTTTLTSLIDGATYNYYVRCQDTSANAMSTSSSIAFSVGTSGVDCNAISQVGQTCKSGAIPPTGFGCINAICRQTTITCATPIDLGLYCKTAVNANGYSCAANAICSCTTICTQASSVACGTPLSNTNNCPTTACSGTGTACSFGFTCTNNVCVDSMPPSIVVNTPYTDQRFVEGVASVPIQITTDEVATCKWSYVDTAYGSMNVNFVTTDGITHTSQEYNPTPNWYTLYIRCADTKGNIAQVSQVITFVVDPSSGGGQV